ncbi:MAG: TIGR02452 family protein [Blautia glucerasea]|nr:TIGR02452 family protein [Blautia glucerasea]
MGRQDNVEIFEDTQRMYTSNERLISAIKYSSAGQHCFAGIGHHWYGSGYRLYQKPAQIVVSPKRTLEAAAPYAYAGKKVCVLNFASATNQGGGVIKGSSAQEEAICRCSTLYPNLKEQRMWNQFYAPHRRAHNPLHNDDCIYTPVVVVFKSDTNYPKLLPEEKWYSVNVMTCAAPNLRERPSNEMHSKDGDDAVDISREELQALHEKRMRKILEIAWKKENEVVILGAFGCGAFCNNPSVVAQAMKTVIQEYRMNFETIEFAVYCSMQYDTNYRIFQQILGGM